MLLRCLASCTILLILLASATTLTLHQQIAFDIYKELIEINTVTATGDTACCRGHGGPAQGCRLRRV
jgi:hypothetical protein